MIGFFDFGLIARDAVGIKAAIILDGGEGNFVDVERWIGQDVVELAKGTEMVVVVADALLDLASETIYSEVHARELDGLTLFLLPVDKDARILSQLLEFRLMSLDKIGGLHKHTSGTAGGIKNSTAVRFDDLNHKANN